MTKPHSVPDPARYIHSTIDSSQPPCEEVLGLVSLQMRKLSLLEGRDLPKSHPQCVAGPPSEPGTTPDAEGLGYTAWSPCLRVPPFLYQGPGGAWSS